jgi:hypothetical protein
MSSAKPDTITETEAQQLKRENIQKLLLLNQYILQPNSAQYYPCGGKMNFPPRDIYHYMGPANDIPNKIINSTDTIDFIRASSDQLSLLVPKLEFFIGQKSSFGDTLFEDQPILFSDYVSSQKMVQFASLRSQGKLSEITSATDKMGTNVGVRSFSWNFENKHQGDRIIKASLSLYFGSMIELLNNTYLDFIKTEIDPKPSSLNPEPEDPKDRQTWLKERIDQRKEFLKQGKEPPSLGSEVSSKSFKILKVKCGWAIPENTDLKLLSESFLNGVKASQRVILLNLSKYNLNFGENGTVTLDIEYVGSFDAQMLSNHTDVLSGETIKPSLRELRLALPWFSDTNDDLYGDGYIRRQIDNRPGNLLAINPKEMTVDIEGLTWSRFGKGLGRVGDAFSETAGFVTGGAIGSTEGGVPPVGYSIGFLATIQGIEAEIALIEEEIEYHESLKPKKKPNSKAQASEGETGADKRTKELNKNLGEANLYLETAKMYVREIRYTAFMKRLIESEVLFSVQTTIGAIRGAREFGGTADNLRVVKLKRGSRIGSASKWHLAQIEEKLIGLAAADRLRGSKDLASFLEEKHILDPLHERENAQEASSTDVNRNYTGYYMRLGDLISVALANAPLKAGSEAAVIMGSYHPSLLGYKHYKGSAPVPLADIPIALTTFSQWFLENVVSIERESWPFRRFLDSLLNDLVSPMMNFGDIKPREKITFGYTTVPLRLDSGRLASLSGKSQGSVGKNFLTERGVSELQAAYTQPDKPSGPRRTTNYMLVFAEQGAELNGYRDDDEARGIYHFFVGADNGLAKKFSFSEKQMPQIRAMNIESNTPVNKAGILVLPQDCSLGMVGNNFLLNGSLIYINADMALGNEAARQLKLGGYYRVVKSSHEIGPGSFNTTVEAIHERMPGDSA